MKPVVITKSYSKAVYEDALAAVQDRKHPCRHFVDWQKREGYEPFQLPEPFSGNQSKLGMAFMGLNPSITEDENIPSLHPKWTFEKYDAFFRSRYNRENRDEKNRIFVTKTDGGRKLSRLWNNIEKFGKEYLAEVSDGDFRLGEHAVLIQACRYKSKKGWLGDSVMERERTAGHQREFTLRLLSECPFRIIVPMGNDAMEQLQTLLRFKKPMPKSVNDAMGNVYTAQTDSRRTIQVIPIKHMSYPPGREAKEAVSRMIKKTLEKGA